jgi:hypothetical protein
MSLVLQFVTPRLAQKNSKREYQSRCKVTNKMKKKVEKQARWSNKGCKGSTQNKIA